MNAEAITDVAAWIGAYPFRGATPRTVEALERRMAALGIGHAIVSGFESLFWEDNLDAFDWWRSQLKSSRLELWPVVNPSRPGQLARLRRVLDQRRAEGTRIRGLRLLPNYHGYRLWDASTADLMQLAREADLVVQVFQRIADERWHWMLKVPPVPDDELVMLVNQFPDNRILISGHNMPQLLAPSMRRHASLYVDISRVRTPEYAIPRLIEQAPWERLVMGSLWPIQIIEATLWQVQAVELEPAIRAGILSLNAERMLRGEAGEFVVFREGFHEDRPG